MRSSATLILVAAAGTVAAMAGRDARSTADPRTSAEEYVFTVTGSVRGTDMAVDENGYAYVTGETRMPGFPTTAGAYDRACGTDGQCDGNDGGKYGIPRRKDAFVTKVAPDGTLSYSTYFGSRGEEFGAGIAVDKLGRAHIIVDTDYVNGVKELPVGTTIGPGCGKSPRPAGVYGARDVIVVRFNAQGSDVEYATCIGGTRDDYPQAIAVDDDGTVYVTGRTESTDFPMVNALQPVHRGLYDIFVARLDSGGKRLAFSTYLGGTGSEVGNGLTVDRQRNIHVLGYSRSQDFPLVLPLQKENRGDSDIVLVKLDANGRLMLYSTYLGTEGFDFASAISTDRSGNTFLAGQTQSKTFPVTQGVFGSTCVPSTIPWHMGSCTHDAFLVSVDPFGRLRYSTYLGGNGSDEGFDVAVDQEGRALVTGRTWASSDFPNVWPPLRLDPFVRAAFLAHVAGDASAVLDLRLVPAVSPHGYNGQSVGLDRRDNIYVMGEGIGSEGLFVAKIVRQLR